MWVVSWMYNGKTFQKEYDSYALAIAEMIKLGAYGMKPTLHQK